MSEVRIVLVTGGTGKLGRSFLSGFARLGYRVAFTSRDAGRAEALRQECLLLGAPAALCVEVDLAAEGAAPALIKTLVAANMCPGVLVNNARNLDFLRPDPSGVMSRANWRGEFELGVIGPYELSLGLASAPESRLRSIINIASMYGVVAPNQRLYDNPASQSAINYGVVKAALIHLSRELAVRLAPTVRVNAVSFGGVDGRVDPAFRIRYAELCPGGRMLMDDEVFGPVRFLAEESSSGITGHNMLVDGGWTIW